MQKTRSDLTAEFVSSVLDYNESTGIFTWKKKEGDKQWNSALGGKIAGHVDYQGYVRIKVGDATYAAHRLAWLIKTGSWPALHIDHIDGKRDNNQFKNLRLARPIDNSRNRPGKRNSQSGIKGIRWNPQVNGWIARIHNNGKENYLGTFKTPEEASSAYQAASKRLFGNFHKETHT